MKKHDEPMMISKKKKIKSRTRRIYMRAVREVPIDDDSSVEMDGKDEMTYMHLGCILFALWLTHSMEGMLTGTILHRGTVIIDPRYTFATSWCF